MGFWAKFFGKAEPAPRKDDSKPEGEPLAAEQAPPAPSEPVAVDEQAAKAEDKSPEPEAVADSAPETETAPEPAPEPEKAPEAEQAPEPEPATEPMSPVAEDRADPEPDGETPAAEEAPATVPLPEADPAPAPPVNGVRYVLTTFGVSPVEPQFMATKKVYQGGSRAEAIAFLRTQAVTEPLLYIEVETPEGLFAIDDRHRVFNESGIFVDF